ncbi:MAG: response regulator [Thermodesulfobacteriota bacterium]|jgi:DNA-binding response OmpR family regulator
MEEIKILLVDDEEDFVNTLAERLNLRDLASETALNGEAALEFVGDRLPDIMVLDLKMPGINGMEVLRRVKQFYPQIQVIILTGHGNDLDEAEARQIGVFDYLKKPVDIELLVERIRAAYQEKRQVDTMSAMAFAEAGEFDTARTILNK